MKLINDKNFFDVQVNWFKKQMVSETIDYWKVTWLFEKDKKIKECLIDHTNITFCDLKNLRKLLNARGLKRLSNAIAVAKKRKNSDKKCLQLMLDKEIILNINQLAKSKNLSVSEFITDSFTDIKNQPVKSKQPINIYKNQNSILIGKLKRIIYQVDDYAVVILALPRKKETCIIFDGIEVPKLLKTVDYKLIGEYRHSPKYGKQFVVNRFEKIGKVNQVKYSKPRPII